MRKLTEEEIEKVKEEIQPKSVNQGSFVHFLESMPREEARSLLQIWQKANDDHFPQLAKKMIEFGLMTQEEFEKEWYHTDMYEVFLYTLLGEIQKAKEKDDNVLMITTSEWKLQRKDKIKEKFGVIIADPVEAMKIMEKEDPEGYKKSQEAAHDRQHATDYLG